MYADSLLHPWLDCLLEQVPGAQIFDSHTHIGDNDPSGFSATLTELLDALEAVNGRAAVFPLAEPLGYQAPNLACARAAATHSDRLTAFARVTPQDRPTQLLEESLAAGARGVKLHLSSDDFQLSDTRLTEVLQLADEQRLPVLVHAGPELDSVRADALAVCARWPQLRLILAHCALTDLGMLVPHLADTPNMFFDTSWWTPANVLALMRLVPPGRILGASDVPYDSPLSATIRNIRCAWEVGLSPDQIASIIGGQLARLVDADEPVDLGPAPAHEPPPPGPLLEVVSTNLLASLEAMQRGLEPGVPLTVARRACRIPDGDPQAPVFASVMRLLDLYEENRERLPRRNQFLPGWDLISAAASIARTPAAPLP